ncbi:MAG TPA: PrsW family glutamic-type intramembrane protease [Anaerolineales bacterium]|nr:PrsW family glutamic-type intramembrane protease [Anaerolineales bacterium]
MVIVIALGIAFLIPLVFLYFIKKRDLFATGKYNFVVFSMVWGLAAYLIAAQLNPFIIDMKWATETQVKTMIGPILEELLKAVILVYLVQRADFNYVVDGAVYGFAAGIGFAMIENVEYVLGYSEIAIVVAVARVFSTNLIHAAGSGVIGVALSLRLGEKGAKGWLWVALGYGLASAFHAIFNTMVSSGAAVVFAVMFGGVGIGFIYLAIQRGLKSQKAFISEKLGDLNRVTQNEVRALNRIEELDELLRPFTLQFGKEKSDMVKSMMSKQAEIAIKTKLLDTTFNKDKKEEMNRIIASLRADMEALRGRLGSYCMLIVRQVYLSQDMNLWGAIQDRVAESSTGQKGGGLWDRAASRVQSSKSKEDEL